MDVQLQELIDKIKNEGVATAETEAKAIIKKAENEAATIIANAKKQAEGIVADAKSEAAKADQAGRAALGQAGRDLILSLKAKLTVLFESILKADTGEILGGKYLEDAVMKVLSQWDGGDVSVELSESDFAALEKGMKARIAQELKKGYDVSPGRSVAKGFRVVEKDGGAYFNFEAEGIAEVLADLLNPKLAKIVKEAADKEA